MKKKRKRKRENFEQTERIFFFNIFVSKIGEKIIVSIYLFFFKSNY